MIKLFGIVFFLFLIIPAYLQDKKTPTQDVAVPCEVITPTPQFVERGEYKKDSMELLRRFERLERKARYMNRKADTLDMVRELGNIAIFN